MFQQHDFLQSAYVFVHDIGNLYILEFKVTLIYLYSDANLY